MAESRLETEWDRTAVMLAKMHNVNCRREDRISDPAKLNPMRARRQPRQKIPLKQLRKMMEGSA